MFVHELLWPFCGSRSASLSPPPILEGFSIISFSQRVKPIRDTQRDFLDPAGYLDRLSPLGDLAKTSGRVNVFAPFCYEVPPYFLGRLVRSHKAGESLFIRLAQAHTSDLSVFLYCRLSTCERLQAQ